MKIGCQTYSWEMHGEDWTGTPDDILDAVAAAGYDGVEFAASMIGAYADRPDAFRQALADRGLEFAAYAIASDHGFTDPAHVASELSDAREAVAFAAEFPRPLLALGGVASPTRDDYHVKIERAVEFYNQVAQWGAEMGVTVCVHPHSHHGSLLESADEYDALLAATEGSGLMFNPDTGHIIRGGQDMMDCITRHMGRIRHVHVKDVRADGSWAPLGQGLCDYAAMFAALGGAGYDAWVVGEEESELAWADPADAIRVNREYLRGLGL